MRITSTSLALLVFGLASLNACERVPTDPVGATPARPEAARTRSDEAALERYIVVIRSDAGSAGNPGRLADEVVREHGGRVRHVFSHALLGFSAELPESAVDALRRNPLVAYIGPSRTIRATTAGPGTETTAPWNLDRIDQRALPLNSTYSYSFSGGYSAVDLWGHRGVRIYVLDSGIYTGNTEFVDADGYVRATVGVDERPEDGMNGQDCSGHGTHVAGIAAGNRYGVAKGADVISVRILGCNGEGSEDDAVAGIDWAANNAWLARAILLMSFTVSNANGETTSYPIDNALNNAQWGGTLGAVAAAGNTNKDACNVSPARSAKFAVGATDSNDNRASFSNYGGCVDLFAPGVTIRSAWIGAPGSTGVLTGTSQAAPHVAGVLAQLMESDPTGYLNVWQALLDRSTTGKVKNAGTGSPNRLVFSD